MAGRYTRRRSRNRTRPSFRVSRWLNCRVPRPGALCRHPWPWPPHCGARWSRWLDTRSKRTVGSLFLACPSIFEEKSVPANGNWPAEFTALGGG